MNQNLQVLHLVNNKCPGQLPAWLLQLYPLRCSRAFHFQTPKFRMLWPVSCCRKTLQPLLVRSSIVCTGSPFIPELTSKLPQSHTNHYIHNPQATLLPCSTIICQLEISVNSIHCFFLPTQQKHIMACMLFNLPHQTSGTNYQLTSSLHVPYHLSKPTYKTRYFRHTTWLVTWPHASESIATFRLVRAI